MSVVTDRSWRLLRFVQPSIKSENQKTHYQRREDEDERSHKIPVDSLRVADSWHGAITGSEQKHYRQHSRDPEGDSVSDAVPIHPEHYPAHNDHYNTRNIEVY